MNKELNLREIQQASLDVLIFFDRICKRLNLKYFLAYGTLIGAIRHNGFIPWDDDIDVWMHRRDLVILKRYFFEHSEELKPYKYCCRENTKFYQYYIPRISNMNYRFVTKSKGNISPEIGVFIDIYPLDNYGKTINEGKRLERKISRINTLYIAYIDGKSYSGGIHTLFKRLAHSYMNLRHGKSYSKKVNDRIDKLLEKYTSDTDSLIGVPTWETYKKIYPKDFFRESEYHLFENIKFPIPKDYDMILKMTYGDYMKLPSAERRIPHHDYYIYMVQ